MNTAHKEFAHALRAKFPSRTIPLHEPWLSIWDAFSVAKSVSTGFVSSAGPAVTEFEDLLVAKTGVPHAVAVSSGTAALSLALQVSGVRPGDEVLMPALTFIGTANAAVHVGAIPHFVDTDISTLGVSVSGLSEYLKTTARHERGACINVSTGNRISALVAVHTFGHIGDLDNLKALTEHYDIALVEDAAQALGSRRDGHHAGSWGRAAALSFNGNKIITTGGGGALLTQDNEIAQRARHLATTARLRHAWEFQHDEVGYNFRMPSINASLGITQLKKLEAIIQKKRKLLSTYDKVLDDFSLGFMYREQEKMTSNYWLQALMLNEPDVIKLEELLLELNRLKLQARPMWNLLSDQKPFKSNPHADLPGAKRLRNSVLNLPSSPNLS